MVRGAGHGWRGWLGGLGGWWLDVKLGLRMLVRHPGLTLVTVFALSIGIPASLIPIHLLDSLGAPLPFDQADRIVGVRERNIALRRTQPRILHDYYVWRDELKTLRELAAARSDPYNIITDDGRAEPIRGSEITASAFRILRVPPFMGRALLDSDEVPGAPDVVVLSYEAWQSRLAGAPDVVGKTIRIGTAPHQVVGVMPEGFLFPLHDLLWTPLRDRPNDYERGMGPDVLVFGRLADGASVEDAQAELNTVASRLADEFPETNKQLRPQVMGYTSMVVGIDPGDRTQIYLIQLIVLVLLAIVCGNVGTLILARTATRSGEISIRTALGASRARIVSQLFVEALVLAVVSAGLGLVLGDQFGKAFADRAFVEAPFWFDLGVKPKTAALALSVAVFCALIAGVVPALKSTGRAVQRSLQNARAGSSVRFGGASTVLIVAEVAMAVGFLIVGATLSSALVAGASVKKDIEPSEYLMAMLRVPWTDHSAVENDLSVTGFRNEVVADHLELARRLAAEPGVRGVAMGNRLPVMEHPTRRVEVDGEDHSEGFEGHRVRIATVDVGFFSGLDAPIVDGRDFSTADLVGTIDTDRTAVIVNTAFVRHVLGDRNPIGQRIRYVRPEDQEPGPWYEIVGVVGHLGMNELDPTNDDGMYHPGAPGEIHPIFMAIHVGADPLGFTPRLREIARLVDPEAMIQYVFPLEDAPNGDRQVNQYALVLLLFLAAIAITLSGAGLYALMSFTVSQRTREIGIRTALGGQPGQIVLVIVRRAFLQLAAGVAAGAVLGVWLLSEMVGGAPPGEIDPVMVVVASVAFMFSVGMLACVVPTIRGLRVRPVDALKEG